MPSVFPGVQSVRLKDKTVYRVRMSFHDQSISVDFGRYDDECFAIALAMVLRRRTRLIGHENLPKDKEGIKSTLLLYSRFGMEVDAEYLKVKRRFESGKRCGSE